MDANDERGERPDGFWQPKLRQAFWHMAFNTLVTGALTGALLFGIPPEAGRGWIGTMTTVWAILCAFDLFVSYGPAKLRRYLNDRLSNLG